MKSACSVWPQIPRPNTARRRWCAPTAIATVRRVISWNGLWREWYENGQLKWTGTYKDEKEVGLWRGWYENGQLESEGNYKDGEWDGLWRGWYENGNKRGEWNWKDGGWDGLQRHWHENGQLWFEINSKNGEEISKKCWDENGNEKECK